MCISCSPSCEGNIIIRDQNNKLICQNADKSNSDESVFIPCPELKNYKNKKVIIQFNTYSAAYGNFSGKVEKIYE
jgi:hypothetical protein